MSSRIASRRPITALCFLWRHAGQSGRVPSTSNLIGCVSPRSGLRLPQQASRGRTSHHVTLGDLFTIKRGLATGNNHFFIVPRARLAELGIPAACVRPILPSPRFVKQEIIDADADGWPVLKQQLALIDCSLSEEEIRRKWPQVCRVSGRRKAARTARGLLDQSPPPVVFARKRQPALFVCTYMGRSRQRPFRFIWNKSRATAANVYHMLYPKDFIARQVGREGRGSSGGAARHSTRTFLQRGAGLWRRPAQNGTGGNDEAPG